MNRIGKEPEKPSDVVLPGQVIWIADNQETGIQLSQLPEAQGALISLDPENGAIRALVGGFAYGNNKYNRVIQAERQPGSAFKPFIYSAALANGFTPASIINDAPVVFEDAGLENTWRPENHNGKFYGPTRLREALYRSQNLVSIRILKQVGPGRAVRYISAFGFPQEKLNKDLSLALGASAVTPLELATGYTVLANGGFRVTPHFIQKVEMGSAQEVLFEANPDIACAECDRETETNITEDLTTLEEFQISDSATDSEKSSAQQQQQPSYAERVMDERTHYLMNAILKDVIRRGTGKRALALNRSDLAGKTGTTNDQKDAWFFGIQQRPCNERMDWL